MVSIVITAHNNDFFLYETLDSINKSNVNFDYEILLGIDNCQITMDSIKNNLDKMSKKLKVFFFPKVGTYVIRNSLAKVSKFDNLLFVDSDDILAEDTLTFVCEGLKNYDLVKYKFSMFSGKFDINDEKKYQKHETTPAGSFGIKKNIFLEMGGFEPWFCAADGEFQWRVEMNEKKVITKKNVGLYYRRHNTNLTVDSKTNMNSPIRMYYHSLKKDKIKNNRYNNLEKINISEFLEINQNNISNYKNIFDNLKLQNDYNFSETYYIKKIQKSKEIAEIFNLQRERSDTEIKKTLEKTKKEINYDKINQMFNGQRHVSIVSKTPENTSNNPKTNAEFLSKIGSKNKKRNR
jgi:hypothetical protein